MSKKYVLVLILCFIVGLLAALYLYNQPVKSLTSASAVHTIEAAELLSAFENDESKANELYLGKVIQVNGSIQEIVKKDVLKSIYLDTGNPISSVICELDADHSLDFSGEEGQQISLKGECSGFGMDVLITRAVMVEN